MNRRNLCKLASAAALGLIIAGCGSSNETPDDGRVRFINALSSTVATPVTVRVNGADAVTNVAFGSVTGTGFEVTPGSQSFQVVQTANGAVVLGSTPVTVQSSIDQFVVASGTAGNMTLTNLGRIDLDTSNTALSGNARIYFINAANVNDADYSFAVQGSAQQGFPASIQDITMNAMTNETLVAVGTGPAVFTANVNGTIVTSNPITLEGTKTYAVILFPGAAAGQYNLSVVLLN